MILFDLFRAEWIKIAGNRWVTAFMIWIFPVGAFGFVAVMALLIVLIPSMRSGQGTAELGLDHAEWTSQAISVWSLPNSLLGRLIMLAFTSVVFAGEYQWGTWKNVVPHSRRVSLVLIKFLAVGLFFVLAFVLMSFIVAVGWGLLVNLAGGTYGPALSLHVLADFVQDYAQQVLVAFTMTIISAGIAALAAMATRSILGGIVISVIATYAEGLSILGLLLLALLLDSPRLVHLYRLTPSYNVANVMSWLEHDKAAAVWGDAIEFSDSLSFSMIVLVVWVVGLVTLTAYLFNKQDLTG